MGGGNNGLAAALLAVIVDLNKQTFSPATSRRETVMRAYLKIAVMAVGLAGLSLPAMAQEPATRPTPAHQGPSGQNRPQPGQMVERFQQELQSLDLSADQKTQ